MPENIHHVAHLYVHDGHRCGVHAMHGHNRASRAPGYKGALEFETTASKFH